MKKSFLCKLFTERKFFLFQCIFFTAFFILPVIFVINFCVFVKGINNLNGIEANWEAYKAAFIPIAIWTCQVGIWWWLVNVDPTYTDDVYDDYNAEDKTEEE